MFPQRGIAAAKAAFSRGKGLQLSLCDLGVSCLNPAQRASSNLSNLSKLVWLQEGEFPLSLQCVGGTCPSPGNVFTQCLPRSTWLGTEPTGLCWHRRAWKAAIVLGPGLHPGAQTHSQFCSEHLGG